VPGVSCSLCLVRSVIRYVYLTTVYQLLRICYNNGSDQTSSHVEKLRKTANAEESFPSSCVLNHSRVQREVGATRSLGSWHEIEFCLKNIKVN
jgi:hypothetical protein